MHQLVGSVDAEHVEDTRLIADRGELEWHVVGVSADREARLRNEVAHVEHHDAAPRVEQRAHEVATDEAGSARYESRPLGDRLALCPAGVNVDVGPRHPLLVALLALIPGLPRE